MCLLGVVFVFVAFLVALHGDSSMDYVSIQPKSPFDAHCRHDDVATALIRGICKMQLAVRIDKRPGKSHMALDGKKTRLGVDLWFPDGRHGDRRKEFQQSHYIFHCVVEVLGCIPEDSTENPVFHRLII